MNSRRVYVCDDDERVRDSLRFLLEQHEFVVSTHDGGAALLAAFEGADKPARGVIVLDVGMEPMTGTQLHRQLNARGLGKRHPIIFLSGRGNIPLAVDALAQGAFSFVEKPCADNALVQLIERACQLEAECHAKAEHDEALRIKLASLSPQQRRLLPLVAAGKLNREIGKVLHLGVRSIEVHRAKLFKRLGVGSAAELATLVAEMRACGLDVD